MARAEPRVRRRAWPRCTAAVRACSRRADPSCRGRRRNVQGSNALRRGGGHGARRAIVRPPNRLTVEVATHKTADPGDETCGRACATPRPETGRADRVAGTHPFSDRASTVSDERARRSPRSGSRTRCARGWRLSAPISSRSGRGSTRASRRRRTKCSTAEHEVSPAFASFERLRVPQIAPRVCDPRSRSASQGVARTQSHVRHAPSATSAAGSRRAVRIATFVTPAPPYGLDAELGLQRAERSALPARVARALQTRRVQPSA